MATTEDPACKIDGTRGGRREGMRSLQKVPPSPSKEWDQCVRKGTLTVGAGMAAGMFLGMMVGMGVPLVWGLGAGVLWSVKRCRALMRDGIMTPEQKRAKKEEKAKGRLESKRSLEDGDRKSKESKKTTPTPEPKKKSGKKQDEKEDNRECCKKLKDLLEKQRQKECNLLKKIEKELEDCGKGNKSIQDQSVLCKKEPSDNLTTGASKINFKATTTVKLFVPQSPAFRTRITANGTDVCMCMPGKDGKMETCPSCACGSLCSSNNEFEEPIEFTSLNEDVKDGVDNIKKVNFPEPQTEADENQNNDGMKPITQIQDHFEPEENRKNPSDLLILQEVSSTCENERLEEDGDYEDEQNPSLFLDELPSRVDEYIEEEVIEIKGDNFEVIIQEVEDDSGDDDDDDPSIPEPEVAMSEVKDGFAQQLTNLDEGRIAEELSKEEVIFVETYKSESWPFSFSLPSLDKFHKKSPDSAFKWPPLPSSIIVKPRKDPSCTCTESTNHQEKGDINLQTEPLNFKVCTCGYPQDNCRCKSQDGT